MILNSKQIIESLQKGQISIDPWDKARVQGASYDLRIGPQGATTTGKRIIDIKTEGYMRLEPGDMALISSLEILKFDKAHAARLGLRSKFARKGLHVTTGLQVDPGFCGRLFISATNLTPQAITLPFGDDFLSIEIHRLDQPVAESYNGPYQNKTELLSIDIEHIIGARGHALSEVIINLSELSKDVNNLRTDVRSLSSDLQGFKDNMNSSLGNIRWTIGIGVAIVGVAIACLAIILALHPLQ